LVLDDAEQPLTVVARDFIHRLYRELVGHDKQIVEIEKELAKLVEQNDDYQRLLTIPGVGPVVATTLLASVGDANYFKNGRQKAIGAHIIWLSGDVTVKTFPGTTLPLEFRMNMVLHAEDQYNFNPGATDIATGIPDNENGRFVVVGFAHGYFQSSTLRRSFSWKGSDLGVASMDSRIRPRHRQPQNNRASTNRI
jgi:hypothetical protein